MDTIQIVDLVFKVLVGVSTLVFSVLGGLGYMKWKSSSRWKKIQEYVDIAFPAVEALVKKTNNRIDDKLVEFLKMVNESLRKTGEDELNVPETTAVKSLAAKKALAEKLER
jgi:cytoskeletal protein RodZ